ncbi:MAG: VIT1/CCC1 transporter family protein [Anaerolineae bacterium]|nr:VIT1/CCC1 transporter family protein [Anaerolineae bacterium]
MSKNISRLPGRCVHLDQNISAALLVSVAVTLVALFVFGFIEGRFTRLNPLRSGGQTVLICGLAAAAAFAIARAIS